MIRSRVSLAERVYETVVTHEPTARRSLDEACQVIVFGSVAAGLERTDSDIDVLCIGGSRRKVKSSSLDLIVIPSEEAETDIWLHSELASHVAEYGVWIKGSAQWTAKVGIGREVVVGKSRRVSVFLSALSNSWSRLEEGFRQKYSIKIRRETQRLILLEHGIPVPPTRVLDTSWLIFSKSAFDICKRLHRLHSDENIDFRDDLFGRVLRHFDDKENQLTYLPELAPQPAVDC